MKFIFLFFLTFIQLFALTCNDCGQFNSCSDANIIQFSNNQIELNGYVKFNVESQDCCRYDYYKITNLTPGYYRFDVDISNDKNDKANIYIGSSCSNLLLKASSSKSFVEEIDSQEIVLKVEGVKFEGKTNYTIQVTKVSEPELIKTVDNPFPHKNEEVTFTITYTNHSNDSHIVEFRDWIESINSDYGTTPHSMEIVGFEVVEGDGYCEVWDEDGRSVYCRSDQPIAKNEKFSIKIIAKVIKEGDILNRVYSYIDGYNGPVAEASLYVKPSRNVYDISYNPCQDFKSGVNTPTLNLDAQNTLQCKSMKIYVDNQPNQQLECSLDCITKQRCQTLSAPQFHDITFYDSDKSTPAPTDFNFIYNDYQDVVYSLNSNQQIYFKAPTKYSNSGRKFMLLGDFNVTGNGNSVIMEFEPGDYYFNDINIIDSKITIKPKRNYGSVRIFVKKRFYADNSVLTIETNENPDSLKIFSGEEFHYDMAKKSSTCSINDSSCWLDQFDDSNGSCAYQAQIESYIYSENKIVLNAYCTTIKGGIAAKNSIQIKGKNLQIHFLPPLQCRSYCGELGLSEGFHIIDPDGGDRSNAFEIYCDMSSQYAPRDLLALPNKNTYNNFVFNSDRLTSTDYYAQATNNSKGFDAIQVYAKTLEVVVDPDSADPISSNGYKTMGSTFSNINLIGTPFGIDWSSTSITHCDESRLRKAYHGQAVKINTLDYTNAICEVDNMKLKIIPSYKFLEWQGQEILQKSCKEMSEAVPENILPSDQIKGFYWIDPNNHGRSSGGIKDIQRPFVVFCWFQDDLEYAWTFYLALDGTRTIKKDDLINKVDTCSKKGLWPFVPNTEETFERVRKFLKDQKNEWINYTGTIQEKVNALTGFSYYLETEQDSPIWPYGSFGVYYDSSKVPDEIDRYPIWGGDDLEDNPSDHKPGYLAGAPMHNIPSITTDYPHRVESSDRKYYSWTYQNYSSLTSEQLKYSMTDNTSGDASYSYSDTMGAKGWRSVLQDLNKTDEWFISRTGAGINLSQADDLWPYFEPNGNYEEGAWLNYLFDSEGRVRHNDDWDANYPYYDYMCMAEDNYDFVKRYRLVPGPFAVVDRDIPTFEVPNKKIIKTKIVNGPIQVDLVLFNEDLTQVMDNNISFGLFLCKTRVENGNEVKDFISFIGQKSDFNTSSGRAQLNINPITEANRRMFFEFLYCGRNDYEWTDCYELNGSCKRTAQQWCRVADSDDFAVRPDRFDISNIPARLIAGKDHNITIKALDNNSAPSPNYNETLSTLSSPKIEYNITKPHCFTGNLGVTYGSFSDGLTQALIHYEEVGEVNIVIKEENGSEYAAVDNNDTNISQRFIKEANATLKYVPDHFDINAVYSNYRSGPFTYLSNDLNMSSELNVTIKAKNYLNNLTKNYNALCYAKNHTIKIKHIPVLADVKQLLYYLKDGQKNDLPLQTIPKDQNITLNYPMNNFTTEDNGTTKFRLFINFSRDKNISINPFALTIKDINTSDEDDVNGSLALNQNANFYYGRLHIPTQTIEGSVGKIYTYYEIFIDDSGIDIAGIKGDTSVDDVNWYQNTVHLAVDGNITTANNSIIDGNKIKLLQKYPVTNSKQQIKLKYLGTIFPYANTIGLDTQSWLLFDKYDSTISKAFGRVIFTNPGGWLGRGKDFSGDTEFAPSKRENKKIIW